MNATASVDRQMTDERLAWHLHNWRQWHLESDRELAGDYPASVGLFTPPRDWDDRLAASDARCAEAIETIVGDMQPAERAAVHHRHLAAVWRFARSDWSLERCYENALLRIRIGLIARGIP